MRAGTTSLLFGSAILFAGALPAQQFKGAAEVLRQAAETKQKPKEKSDDLYAPHREKLKTFEAQNQSLAPAEAAKQWLDLLEEFREVSKSALISPERRAQRMSMPLQIEELMAVLPPPSAWPEIEKAVESRSASVPEDQQSHVLGLRLIAHTLTRNTTARSEDLKALSTLMRDRNKGGNPGILYGMANSLNQAILATMDDPDAILRLLEMQISGGDEFSMGSSLPNLVAIVGPAKAEAFLRKALKTSSQIRLEPDTATYKLALKVGVEMADQMKTPQWGLIQSLDAVELYEAMDKKFNAEKKKEEPTPDAGFFPMQNRMRDDYEQSTARLYYFLGLIGRGRIDDAVKVAAQFDKDNTVYFPPELIKEMERAGLTSQLNKFFATLLKENPEAPFWDQYVRVAAHAGHSEDALSLLRVTLEKPGLSKARVYALGNLLPGALLANDDVEAAVVELRRCLTNEAPKASSGGGYISYNEGWQEPEMELATVGKLLERKGWLEEGVAAAKEKLKKKEDSANFYRAPGAMLADFLTGIGRGPEAEEILQGELQRAVQKPAGRPEFDGYLNQAGVATQILLSLAQLYHSAGRHEDVIRLFDDAPYWGAKDLAQLHSRGSDMEMFSGHHSVSTPAGYYLAAALAKTGRSKEAIAVLDTLFEQSPGLDRLYELLLELDPTNAPVRLDELFARDQFEERPLIWKAHWLRTQGKLEEAETVARKAIAVDPSDGEEGPGDRLRAYAELAEIRAARGDEKEAGILRGAVKAIRESETADRFHEAGLLKRAVTMYEDSLKHFTDAYCIQSRLAIQLSDLGMHAEAEEHYRKAYELMPSSFGRVESHCFGCERAFDGERAQNIAEKVFTELAQKTPEKPQVHYLLGYLREEQDRLNDAVPEYRQAVKLDADYLNAWHKLQSLSEKVLMPVAERDSVVLNVIRLDPRGRHGEVEMKAVSDLAALWKSIAELKSTSSPVVTNIYVLRASKQKLEEKSSTQPDTNETQMMQFRRSAYSLGRSRTITSASAVCQNAFIRAGIGLATDTSGGTE